MEKTLTILQKGMNDDINILNEFEMVTVMGGNEICEKKYALLEDGTILCGCGYQNIPTPPGGQ